MNLQKYQANTYRRMSVETASPGTTLLILYDAAIRFVNLSKQYIESGDVRNKGVYIAKAYRIISEFINALDYSVAPDLCSNLEGIYGFMLEKLSEANAKMSSKALEPVLSHLKDLRETWAKAIEQASTEKFGLGEAV